MLGTGIITGMYTTFKETLTRRVTINYPWEKRQPYERFRGYLAMGATPTGQALCTGCGVCVTACPDRIIKVEKDPDAKARAKEVTVEVGRCMFCGLCEEACKFGAIRFVTEYETAVVDKAELVSVLVRDGVALRPAPPRGGKAAKKEKVSEGAEATEGSGAAAAPEGQAGGEVPQPEQRPGQQTIQESGPLPGETYLGDRRILYPWKKR